MRVLEPIVIGGFHRQRDQRLVIGKPRRLHVPKDRVLAVRDASNLEHGGRTLGTGAEGGEFSEWAFRGSVLRMDEALNDHLGMCRDFEINGIAFDHLDIFAENSGAVFQFVEIFMFPGPVRHDFVHGM